MLAVDDSVIDVIHLYVAACMHIVGVNDTTIVELHTYKLYSD